MDQNAAVSTALARIAEEALRRTGELDLSRLPLHALPHEIEHLTWLRRLDCWGTQVDDLAPIEKLTALQHLDCSGTQVNDLAPIKKLTALQHLHCGDTQVNDLTPLEKLTALQHLDCSRTQVNDLAPIEKLTALQYLDCSDTQVNNLTPLEKLTALQYIDCSDTQVNNLTPLEKLTALQYLSCSDTQVNDLAPIEKLTALQHLGCWNTQVNDLAPLEKLTALRYLDCSGCRLKTLPAFILDNTALTLIAYKTEIPDLPFGLLSRGPFDDCRARVKAHYDDLAQEAKPLSDIKLLLLGNGGVGKTQIARWLSGLPFDPHWNSTHGIVIFSERPETSVAARLHLKLWDFGGQDIYHGTHAMFLRGPAVLLLAWSKDQEYQETYEHEGLPFRNHPLAYWADVARHLANPHSPVLIVQTKCDTKDDEERAPIPTKTLQSLPHTAELHASPKANRHPRQLAGALGDAIDWLRDPTRLGRPQIGAVRLRAQRRLEAMRDADQALPQHQRQHRVLTTDQFEAICTEEGGVSSTEHFLDYLDANGTIFYRPGLLPGQIILDQTWALDAIYTVFDRTRVYRIVLAQNGRVSPADLARHVWQHHTKGERALLFSMMRACNMCFPHRRFADDNDETAEYIVPDLLPERQAVEEGLRARWSEDRPGESAIFRYPILHLGMIRSIMSEIGKLAGINALYWKGGLCTFDADTRSRLLIEQHITGGWKGTLQIRTQDGQAATLLQKAIDLVKRVQTNWSMADIEPERTSPPIPLPPGTEKITPAPEPSTKPKWYVSYAWSDAPTEEERKNDPKERIVDQLCAAAEAQGHPILRDKNVLSLGDIISAFMQNIGEGDRVFVILSEKYLRSPYCMFELSEVWRTSQQNEETFRQRTRVYSLPDVSISEPEDWVHWHAHWKRKYRKLNKLALKHGPTSLGAKGNRRLSQMQTFYIHVSDILASFADIVQPRTLEELLRYGFTDTP